MKKFILPALFVAFASVLMFSCDTEDIDPCEDWWLDVELDEGVEWLDADGDGEPDGLTIVDGDEVITLVCDDTDADDDCIPDCFEEFMDGEIEDGEDGEEEEDEDEDGDGEEDEDDEDEDGPCEDWWVELTLIDGAFWVLDDEGTPVALTYTEGGETITLTCVDDADEDCIPDCYEEYIL